jgi:murein DD-endopeptidase MepM/ murein hydrolase activator NlpD
MARRNDPSRRRFFGWLGAITGGLIGAHVLKRIFTPNSKGGVVDISLVEYEGNNAFQFVLQNKESYETIAVYFTGNKDKADIISMYNDNTRLRVSKPIYIPIWEPNFDRRGRVSGYTRNMFVSKILYATFSNFSVKSQEWVIDQDESASVAAVMENFLDHKKGGYWETLGLLLVMNNIPLSHDLKTALVYSDQKIIVPTDLILEGVIQEDNPKPAAPQPRVSTKVNVRDAQGNYDYNKLVDHYGRYQNSFRSDRQKVVSRLRRTDKFGAGRVRSGGRASIHNGLDLACPVGTALYPIGAGRVISVKDYAKTSYWRNGKSVKVKMADGTVFMYLHLQDWTVKKGDEVGLDTVIAHAGISGNASKSNPHVHIHMYSSPSSKKAIDPLPYVDGSKDADLRKKMLAKSGVYGSFLQDVAGAEGY